MKKERFAKLKNKIDTLKCWLSHPKLPIYLAIIAILLTVPSLSVGFRGDDYMHRAHYLRDLNFPKPNKASFGQFGSLTDPLVIKYAMDFGIFPWWTYEKIRVAFWRPVSEITHWLDYSLWPNHPSLMYLQSLIWFGAIIFLVSKYYSRIIGPTWIAGLAALLYALDYPHGSTVGWIASRNVLIATFFGVLTLIFHDKWRKDKKKTGILLSCAFLLIGLLSAEFSIGTCAYLLSYAICLEKGTVQHKLITLLPYGFMVVVWRIVYNHLGYGTWGSGMYIDPVNEPLSYFAAILERAPFLLLGQWSPIPTDIYPILSASIINKFSVMILVCIVVVVLFMIPLLRRKKTAVFWTLGMIFSLMPVCATTPQSRLLFFVGLGAMGLLAEFIGNRIEKSEWLPMSKFWRGPVTILVVIFVIIHLIISPLLLPVYARSMKRNEFLVEKPAINLPFNGENQIVLINPPIALMTMYYRSIREFHNLPNPFNYRILSSGTSAMEIMRIDERTLEITQEDGFIYSKIDSFFRGPQHPMTLGQKVEMSGMTATVLSLTRDQRPKKVSFRFDVPLHEPSLKLLQWKSDNFVPYIPPSIGETDHLEAINLFKPRKK